MPEHPIHQQSEAEQTPAPLATLEQREEIVYYCLQTVAAQLNFNTQGNISVRIRRSAEDGGDAMLITPSGTRYDRLRPEHLFVVSIETGEILESPFEDGDQVEQDQLLYRIDPGSAQTALQQAQLSVQQAQMSYDTLASSLQVKAIGGGPTVSAASAFGSV